MSKFFTYEERLTLQIYLKERRSFKEIGRRLDKNPTTISREVRKYVSEVATGYPIPRSSSVDLSRTTTSARGFITAMPDVHTRKARLKSITACFEGVFPKG